MIDRAAVDGATLSALGTTLPLRCRESIITLTHGNPQVVRGRGLAGLFKFFFCNLLPAGLFGLRTYM
jgi:hypothetical protein